MATPKELGKMFKDAREAKGVSQDAASAATKIHPNVVRDIENGVFDRLGKPYVKSFLKKYSAFLELDEKKILDLYENVSEKLPGRQFTLADESANEKDEAIVSMNSEKMQAIIVGVLAVVLIVLIFIFIGMMKSRMSKPVTVPAPKKTVVAEKPEAAAKKAEPEVKKPEKRSLFAKKARKVTITLEALGDVWVLVKSEGKTVFAETMKKGATKTLETESTFNVLTGKGENLEFTVNGKDLGVIQKGVVKNINISADGVMIGNNVITRLD